MELGFIGLGKMGGGMTRRLVEAGHRVVGYNRSPEPLEAAAKFGVEKSGSIEELVGALKAPKVVWSMVPSGGPTEDTIQLLGRLLTTGDIVIDGGNSNYKDSIRRSEELAESGIAMIDAGTSGGVWGYTVGYCLMCGGDPAAYETVRPAMETLAPPNGAMLCGTSGAGHFVKMVHNGIEYGMLQAYGEGFEIMQASRYDLDLHAISTLWGQGSVVRSWLLELLERALAADKKLEHIKGFVQDSGEGRWTIQEAIDLDVPAPVLTLSLFERFHSRQEESFSAKVIAALRNQFGGHAVKEEGK